MSKRITQQEQDDAARAWLDGTLKPAQSAAFAKVLKKTIKRVKASQSKSTQRQQRRRASLNEIAQAAGFASWAIYETAVLNGRAKLRPAKP